MAKILKGGIFLAIISCLFMNVNIAEAKRMMPQEPTPVVYKGVKFVAAKRPRKEKINGNEADVWFVEGWDVAKNTKIFEKEAYKININTSLEYDVQMVFITSLTVEDNKLVVANENGGKYQIDIPQEILKE
jgi:hypothetical protein